MSTELGFREYGISYEDFLDSASSIFAALDKASSTHASLGAEVLMASKLEERAFVTLRQHDLVHTMPSKYIDIKAISQNGTYSEQVAFIMATLLSVDLAFLDSKKDSPETVAARQSIVAILAAIILGDNGMGQLPHSEEVALADTQQA